MDRHARLSALLDLLGERGKVTVDEIADELNASAATVRRDLDHLAEQQLLTRTRGGAVAQNISYDLPLRYKAARNAREKGRIARAAAAMVAPGAVVGVNGGTTTTEIARSLVSRADIGDSGERTSLTIVTNALNIANELVVRPQVKIVVTGGVARPQSFELTGPLGTHLLEEITLDIVFLGVDAVDPSRGAFAHNEAEASINRLMTERADRVVVVADSSKLDRSAFAHICPVESIDMLLTDSNAPAELIQRFDAAGVPVKAV
ncbi:MULTISPECIES: DeoR/GlpR family DNA-binding transcription regulator [Saccharopolyspora]|uniref:DeoR/GlpR transcriptional regulator n=1 Tax=Saccharopolyspora elongata TaxID=2530387 RepID=A0A4R4ZCF1_9PSEU|nr:DeoR/GlpR family DNA-binding transcription regulator [Saccharopolyspora elongata]TDD55114.1 DeoR/GlpR transcriptional regulator [Saccharopolyspora elongata]